jgi:hypothetical protein
MAPTDFGPLNAPAGQETNLPLPITRFFGREQEITVLSELLRDRDIRLLTLTGPGGTGKTRLSLEVARRLADAFEGAVWFAPLADLSDPTLIPDAILDALRLSRSPQRAPLDQVVEHLTKQPAALLVLDNFEHLIEGRHANRSGAARARADAHPARHLAATAGADGRARVRAEAAARRPTARTRRSGCRCSTACACSLTGRRPPSPTSRSRRATRPPSPRCATDWKAFRSPWNSPPPAPR